MDIEIEISHHDHDQPTRIEHAVVPQVLLVGRSKTADISLESSQVSRNHARLTLLPGGWILEDISRNGTTVGAERLHQSAQKLEYGATFTIGPFSIRPRRSTWSASDVSALGGDADRALAPALDQEEPQTLRRSKEATKADDELKHAEETPPKVAAPARRQDMSDRTVVLRMEPQGPTLVPTPESALGPARMVETVAMRPVAPASPRAAVLAWQDQGAQQAPTRASGILPVATPAANASAQGFVAPLISAPGTPANGVHHAPAPQAAAPQGASLGASADPSAVEELVALRRQIHTELLKNLDLAKIDPKKQDPSLRPRVLTALKRIVREHPSPLLAKLPHDALIGELLEEALGLGPLEPLLADPSVTEIMVVDPATIYVERGGRLEMTTTRFTDEDRVRAVIERIVTPLGRRIDESQPLVDARLPDGSRVNAIIRPLALRGTCITIRRFPKRRLTVEDFLRLGSISAPMARFLERAVIAKKNILISGGTGSGKTTLLNVLSASIPSHERIVTIEDAAELQLHQPHVVSLETKHANMEGKGAFTIRDLVKNALRMRPDRIVVGECRGGEALDMLQAMNTGHDGSLTTLHANSPLEALARLETLTLMSGVELPSQAIREQITRSIQIIVQQTRLPDGTRKITEISEVDALDKRGRFQVRPIFELEILGAGADGRIQSEFGATGYMPSFVAELVQRGFLRLGEPFLG